MNTIFRLAGALTSLYSIAIVVRLLSSWIQADHQNAFMGFLHRITEPWLGFFRRLGLLNVGGMDFSPLLALSTLSFFSRLFLEIDLQQGVNVFGILALLLSSLWAAVSFVLGFFFIIFLLRLFSWKTAKDSYLPLWQTVSQLSAPAEDFVNKLIYSGSQFDYGRLLLTGALLSLGTNIAGSILIALASFALGGIAG